MVSTALVWPDSHLTTDADGLVESVCKLLLAKVVDCLTEELVGQTGKVPQASNRVDNIHLSAKVNTGFTVRAHLAILIPFPLSRLSSAASFSKSRSIRSASLFNTDNKSAPFDSSMASLTKTSLRSVNVLSPSCIESCSRSFHCIIHILLLAMGNFHDHLPIGWVHCGYRCSRCSSSKLVVAIVQSAGRYVSGNCTHMKTPVGMET